MPGEETVDCVIFSAEECWALRCAVLHAGNYETEKTTLSRVLFHAHKREGKNYSHIVRDSHFADFDVIYICEKLCNAAKNYYSNSQNKNRFDVDEVRKENSYAPQNTIVHFMDRNLFGLCGGTFHDGPVSDENAKSVDQLGRFPGVVFAGKYSPGDILFGQHMAKEAVPQAGTVRGGAFRCEYPHRHRGLGVFHCSPADAVTAGLLPPRKQGESV